MLIVSEIPVNSFLAVFFFFFVVAVRCLGGEGNGGAKQLCLMEAREVKRSGQDIISSGMPQ